MAIGRKRHTRDIVGVSLESAKLFPRLNVPESHGLIIAPRERIATIGRKRHTSYGFCMAFELTNPLSRLNIPEPYCGIGASRQDVTIIGRKCYAVRGHDKAFEAANFFSGILMSNPIIDWLEKRKLHRELLPRWDALEKQAHAGMVFYGLSQGHREVVTEKLKADIEQLRDDFGKADIKPPDDPRRIFRITAGGEIEKHSENPEFRLRSLCRAPGT